jgi:tryptophanyl-tRNA synthetase
MVLDFYKEQTKNQLKSLSEFGIQSIDELEIPLDGKLAHPFLRRRIMFGHTDAGNIFEAIQKGKEFVVMTGIKPTGHYHIGSLTTCKEVLYFQKLGGKVYFCVADLEAYLSDGLSLKESHENAIDNIADILALGLVNNGVHIYKQSKESAVLRLASQFSDKVTYNTMKAIFGEQSFGIYQSALIQAADILLPQLDDFEGPIPTIVPVGIEQAPHARFSRDIARKKRFRDEFGFQIPSFTFHQLISSLGTDEKMSKSAGTQEILTLAETEKSLKKKIARLFTGGCENKKEQLEKGGKPGICRVFDLFRFFFMDDDKELQSRFSACRSGEILCGECKQDLFDRAHSFIMEHQEKKGKMKEHAKQILEEN